MGIINQNQSNVTASPIKTSSSSHPAITISPGFNHHHIDDKDEELYHVQLVQQLNYELINNCSKHHGNFSTTLKVLNEFNSKLSNQNFQFDFIIENQRGLKLFGIPLFSKNSLIPIIDPSNFQLLNGKTLLLTYNQLQYYNLPDFNWTWCWDNWYILMYNDVDDQGWLYSNFFFSNAMSDKRWKGKYYHGNFIRRRIWIKLRKRVDEAMTDYGNGNGNDNDNDDNDEVIGSDKT